MLSTSALVNPQRLLEISTRPFLYSLSQKYGKKITKLKDIPDEVFTKWKQIGYEWIWFMGVWQLGEKGRNHDLHDPDLIKSYDIILPGWTPDDVIGSPYSIVKYSINSELGTEEDIVWLRGKLSSLGMKLMLDFVPNHSALDAPQISTKKKFYVRAPQNANLDLRKYMSNGIAYGCGEYCAPWTDVAQFNYCDSEFREHQISVLNYIASIADGVRCDMAHLILTDKFWNYWCDDLISWGYSRPSTEFWADAIAAVKKTYPSFIFMAECYADSFYKLQECGFDYTYEKEMIDYLKNHDIGAIKGRLFSGDDFNKFSHFTENHDEPRTMETFWHYSPSAIAAAAALLTLPGMRFFFQDQDLGYANKLDVHLRRAASEPVVENIVAFYQKLYQILNLDVMKFGKWTPLDCSGSTEILTWKYVYEDSHILICVHFGEKTQGGNVVLDDAPLTAPEIPVKELLSGVVYMRNPNELRNTGLVVVLYEYEVQIFVY